MKFKLRFLASLAGISMSAWVGLFSPLGLAGSAHADDDYYAADNDDYDYGADRDDYDRFDEEHNAAYLFRDDLAPFGEWFRDERYGYVWRPTRVRSGWRPYTDGQWVLTDYGWAWVPEEEWGWAPFHYGRWFQSSRYGWSWVPGRQWAPAWVSWRRSDDYVGWAPLSPDLRWRPGRGDYREQRVDPSWYSFVETRHFVDPRVREYVVVPSRNVTIVNVTKNVTDYTIINNRVANHSLNKAEIETVVGRRIEPRHVDELERARPKLHLRARKLEKEMPAATERVREVAPPPQPAPEKAHGRDNDIRQNERRPEASRQAAPPRIEERQDRHIEPAARPSAPEKAHRRDNDIRQNERRPEASRQAAPPRIERNPQTRESTPRVERQDHNKQRKAGKQAEQPQQPPEQHGSEKKKLPDGQSGQSAH